MSVLDDDIYDDGRSSFEELLAKGEYKSSKEDILKGFKLFQKKYVFKNVCLQMFIVVLAIVSQILSIAGAAEGEDVSFSYMLIVMCVVLGGYFLIRPKNTFRKLEDSLGELEGTVYEAEIYTDKIKISTLYDPYISEEAEKEAEAEEKETDQKDNDPDSELPPATIIHLDNAAVEIVESSELFIVYIKKFNVFVIPKSAFKPYEVMEIKNRLSNIMGVRYKGE
ncbi:MAG: hypothetical protein ACI4J0_03900 [Huintestinicola sp.]|uniref:hypothetical protein n=1 Tax=Huintestinicola sp. TaxID=2981661 RepID=UPI003F0F9BA4